MELFYINRKEIKTMLPNSTTAGMNEYFSAMSNGGKPFKTYKKSILGKVFVHVLSLMTGTPTPVGLILEGDPRKNDPDSMVDVWSEHEDYFFRRMNRLHLEQGTIREYKRTDAPSRERTVDEFSDDELKALINKPFLSLKNTLNKTSSIATLFRIQTLAGELDKSDKVMKAIESRISEVQEAKTPQIPAEIEEEL